MNINPNSLFFLLYTSDVNKIHIFWKELGITKAELQSDKCVVDIGGIEIHYILDSSEPFEEYQFATAKKGRGIGMLCYFEVSNIETFHSLVSTYSPQIFTKVKNNHWDMREFLFSDPDGYLFVAYGN